MQVNSVTGNRAVKTTFQRVILSVMRSAVLKKFLDSMTMNYEKWHDRIGYDIDALDALSPSEKAEVVKLLAQRVADGNADWYDLEARLRVGTPAAYAVIHGALSYPHPSLRLHAAEYLAPSLSAQDRGAVELSIANLLCDPRCSVAIGVILRVAERFGGPVVRDALLWCAINGADDLRVHAAALALYLAGGAPEAFDWNQRPLFLTFRDPDRAVRKQAMQELQRRIDVASAK